MDPVLCALDFSEASPSVLTAAVSLATRFKVRLIVLYAYRIIPENEAITDYRKAIVKKAHDDFYSLGNELGLTSSVPYEFRAEVGFLSDRIDSFLSSTRAAFVVIGKKLAMEINEQKGMSLEEFISRASVPVLIVPEK